MMQFIKSSLWITAILFFVNTGNAQKKISFSVEKQVAQKQEKDFYSAVNSSIQYVGRIQKTDPSLPRFWSPGVYIRAKFKGNRCSFFLNDEVLYGSVHNYVEIVIDGKPFRLQTKYATNKITVNGLQKGEHSILICKDTESGNGYLEFGGIVCEKLLTPDPKPSLKIEFIGNSITCGFGADESEIPCGKGEWYDEHNAYLSYGPLTARALNAQWHITAVSGIGLIHSCCDMSILMPQVYDKIDLRDDSIPWNFENYIPDIVTICLGQNDGIQDSATFCNAYVDFIKTVRNHYPDAQIVLLTSPMADTKLKAALQNYLTSIVAFMKQSGDKKTDKYFFKIHAVSGCGSHPSLKEQQQMSNELVAFLSQKVQ
jgi:hypothetical protein